MIQTDIFSEDAPQEKTVYKQKGGVYIWCIDHCGSGFFNVRWRNERSGMWHDGGRMYGTKIIESSTSSSPAPDSYSLVTESGIKRFEPEENK